MEYKWIKQHPLSACSVGDVEEISDERAEDLLKGKYITPYDPTNDVAIEVDPVEELNALRAENDTLKAKVDELEKQNQALLEEINIFKAPPSAEDEKTVEAKPKK